MKNEEALKDTTFLKQLDLELIKKTFVRIFILDDNEHTLTNLEGRVSNGNLTLDGKSAVRRTGSLTVVLDNNEDSYIIDDLLKQNRKIKLFIGIENNINNKYDKIIWFPQGIYVINSIDLTHNTNSITASLQIKDKMCLLNGDCGGCLPAIVKFGNYNQEYGCAIVEKLPENPYPYIVYQVNNKYYLWDEFSETWSTDEESESVKRHLTGEGGALTYYEVKQNIFDIIRTLVCNYGGEDLGKIIINGIDKYFINHAMISVSTSSQNVYYNDNKKEYSLEAISDTKFEPGEVIGFMRTEYVYGELTTGYNDTICTVLDKIKAKGNFEYFYDVDGNFIFQEIPNYLNNQYEPIKSCYDEENRFNKNAINLNEDGSLLNNMTYKMDLCNDSSSIYTFGDEISLQKNPLIISYANKPNYNNIKNDFHLWGSSSANAIPNHYHLAIKKKPEPVEYATEECPYNKYTTRKVKFVKDYNGVSHIQIVTDGQGEDYTPLDWRAELYLQGLAIKQNGGRPDMHQQELLDLFEDIYDFEKEVTYNGKVIGKGAFKAEVVTPSETTYWMDYIDSPDLYSISVDSIGYKIYTEKQTNVCSMYNEDALDNVVYSNKFSDNIKSENINLAYSKDKLPIQISDEIYKLLTPLTYGYSMQDYMRSILYKYTSFTAGISLTSIPIYYLEPNRRITVWDKDSNIYGDYIINSISYSIDTKSTMSISATRIDERI